jgi:hypothetical protein
VRDLFQTLGAVLVGLLAWVAVGSAGFWLLRTGWLAYRMAEPAKDYDFGMLLARLTVGAVATVAAGAAASARGRGVSASLWTGAALLAVSAPIHLTTVWRDYPVWYHAVYLLSLVPLARLGATLTVRRARGPA